MNVVRQIILGLDYPSYGVKRNQLPFGARFDTRYSETKKSPRLLSQTPQISLMMNGLILVPGEPIPESPIQQDEEDP
ncbi:hypothetical protein LZY01_01290 [Levilactobacillus zymae]|uniref:Uncharacterized protein n=1 Tax=Levilactobacillus zymae TaxID=267363 RepID=A0ABQ0WTX5_9LACO|nr:hypothetical protein LZY01_01290 [Levilactobacillus zymae]